MFLEIHLPIGAKLPHFCDALNSSSNFLAQLVVTVCAPRLNASTDAAAANAAVLAATAANKASPLNVCLFML